MSTPCYPQVRGRIDRFLIASLLLLTAGVLRAEDIKVEARLIWGTDENSSKNPKHQLVDSETSEKLQKIFKWKYYFLEKRVVETISHRSAKTLVMSPRCSIEVRELAGAPVEVTFIGNGRSVNKTTKSLNRGEWIIIGGDDTNQCAWFVILSRPQQ